MGVVPLWGWAAAALAAAPLAWWGIRRAAGRLDRWLLSLEERGLIFYRHKQPSSGGLGCLVELQKTMELGVKQVLEVDDHSIRKQSPGIDGAD